MDALSERMSRLTMQFAQSVCLTLKDIIDVHYAIREKSCSVEPFSNATGTIAFIHFGGTMQGDCILVTSHATAIKLIECYQQKNGSLHSTVDRGIIDELISEILNDSVGRLMPFMEREIEALSYMPPIIVSGNVTFPRVTSNSLIIRGETGDVTCVLAINMVSLKIVETLKTVSEDLVKKTLQASVDSLTGLKNRRYFDESFEAFANSSKVMGFLLSIMIIDIDNLKLINDTFGHQTGDLVLVTVAQTILMTLRGGDIACRYGGDEIAVFLPNTVLGNAVRVAERIRQMLNKKSRDLSDRQQGLADITVSMGIAQLKDKESRESLFDRADKALFAAKKNGRNRIEVELSEEVK